MTIKKKLKRKIRERMAETGWSYTRARLAVLAEKAAAPDPEHHYRCHFCEKESPVREWKEFGEKCPKCGRIYDAILAQDSEE